MGIDKTVYEKRMLEELENPPLMDPHALASESKKSLFFYGKTFVPMKMVDYLMNMLPMGYLITPLSHKKDSTIWRYDDNTGIYTPYGINWIQKTIQDLLDEDIKSSRQNEVIQQLRVKTYDWDNEFQNEPPGFVVVLNGVLSLADRTLHPYSPIYKAKARLPIYYDPDATCPRIDLFFIEVFHPDDITTIQEWCGYGLVIGYPFAKILMLIGDGANGKTTFLNLLTAAYGSENVSKKTLFELNNDKFAASKLFGKFFNISPDVSEDEIKHTGKLKALTGNEEIDAREIYQSSFQFVNRAKLSCAANKPPRTPDVTRAWFRRMLFVICDRIFTPEEQDPHLLEALTTKEELSGFLNLMLDSQERLLKNGKFSREETPDEVQEKYDLMSDPITAFLEDCVIVAVGVTIGRDELYLAFRSYCRIRGFTPCLKGQLTQELNNRYSRKIAVTRIRKGDKRIPTWSGLTLDLETREKWESGQGGTNGCTLVTFIQKKGQERITDTLPTYPSLPKSEDSKLIQFSVQYLKNNGFKATIANYIQALQDDGFKIEDFKRLNKYKDIFDINSPYISLIRPEEAS